MAAAKRLGRPKDSDSAETGEKILAIARHSFAELGYEGTTNKHLATKIGITTGALYHYYPSKGAIYAAVYQETEKSVYAKFEAAIEGIDSFVERVRAVLETAHRLNREDPSLARFLGSARVDFARHDELRIMIDGVGVYGSGFFDELIGHGVKTGEIRKEHRDMLRAFLRTIVVGLTDAVSHDTKRHRLAVDATMAALEGGLVASKKISRK
jgi:AcrR family transcriptional regulator